MWFYQFVFAATCATIVSGAIAERCQLTAYFTYSVVLTGRSNQRPSSNEFAVTILLLMFYLGLIYPVACHWSWDPSGWLYQMEFQDFAGGCTLHMLSGVCSLSACWAIGPRKGRFDENGKPVDITGHSVPLTALGGFILLVGFLAFNAGCQVTL